MNVRIVWFRRDLRLADHPAVVAALDGDEVRVVPLFVLDHALLDGERMSPARVAYLCDALADLDGSLRARGAQLVVRRGDPQDVVPEFAAEVGATAVHWSADCTPYAERRDRAVQDALEERDIAVRTHPGLFVQDPGSVRNGSGDVYRVFTPFHRSWRERPIGPALRRPSAIPAHDDATGEDLPTTSSLGAEAPDEGFAGGETAAQRRLDRFLAQHASDYADRRDAMGDDGTSRLSADLHFGTLSPRAVWHRLDQDDPGHAAFGRQLAWRDFYSHVLAEWPEVGRREFDPQFRDLPWHDASEAFDAWREGRTGYPIVDAGMRQLAASGWMHNRARMIVASFLCKDLLVDWRLGETHFLRHLVDGDMANNNGGWQWAAGTGTDAQPYFRIFNPVRQGQRFDPDGAYVRRWVPELADVPRRWIHQPWELPDDQAEAAGVRLGTDYPLPIVDHAEARKEALDWFGAHRRG